MMKKEINFNGIGIHSGLRANVRIIKTNKPGIYFKRTDLKDAPLIPATYDNVFFSGLMSTTVGTKPNIVQTIEHFMAALYILQITSIIVEIDGPEFPIMDGGAQEFLKILGKFRTQNSELRTIVVKREIVVHRSEVIKQLPLFKRILLWLHNLKTGRREDGFVKLSPSDKGLEIDATLVYPDKIIGTQRAKFCLDYSDKSIKTFQSDFAKSRTFGRVWEWEYLKKRGMGRGASESNVIAINENGDGVLNGLHFSDEFVRHKIIDILGDLYLAGGNIYGKLESYKGSHAMNNLLLRKLFSDKENYLH